MEDVEELEDLANTIKDSSLCGLGQTAPNPVLSTLKNFREEYIAHVTEHRCPAGVCKALINYHITDKCIGCGKCAANCPKSTISTGDVIRELPNGKKLYKHVIDTKGCIKCGACKLACPAQAIITK